MKRIVLMLSILAFNSINAKSLADVNLEDSLNVLDNTLVLNGIALRKKLFIKVYVGGLYLKSMSHNASEILSSDSPRVMVMKFLYNVSKDKMCDAWIDGVKDNFKEATSEVNSNIKSLCDMMEDVPKGGEIKVTYIPGNGSEVSVNSKVKGSLSGKATADAILSTWLGEDPGPGAGFKNMILGKE